MRRIGGWIVVVVWRIATLIALWLGVDYLQARLPGAVWEGVWEVGVTIVGIFVLVMPLWPVERRLVGQSRRL